MIPPKVDTGDGVSPTELSELCYQYKYDSRNRPFAKKLPGKDWEYTIFNKLDQPIMTQDPNLRADDQWLFTKYDALGRTAYNGVITMTNQTRSQIQQEVNDLTTPLWVESSEAAMIGGVTMYYNDGGYPNAQNAEVLSINYYDDYDFLGNTPIEPFVQPATVYNEPTSNRTKSLATGSKIKVLGTSYWINSVTYYDKKARPLCIATTNDYLNTQEVVENKLDFVGKTLETKTTHTKGSNAAIVTIDTFEYDHMGRELQHTKTINGQEEVIAEKSYNDLGRLAIKTVGGGLQNIDYTYNVRGWLMQINDPSNLGSDLFAFRAVRNNPTHGATAMFTNNIAEAEWKTANDNTLRWYAYEYDSFYRILSATNNDNRYNLSGVTYDKMGNIESLTRNGWQNTSSYDNLDVLSYTYGTGNKLLSVTDNGNKTYGFKDGSNTDNDYSYDDNGNLLTDKNKGITSITYNHFNFPTRINVTNADHNGNLQYIYDANGGKLRKIATDNGNVTTIDYVGDFIYENGSLKSIMHPEGYIEQENDGTFTYVYQHRDIWNNTRISYADNDNDGKVDFTRNSTDIDGDGDYHEEIRREQNLYPFGMEHEGYNYTLRGAKNNLKTYQGQELTEDLGLNTHEWRYRMSDRSIGRFWQIDPLAEKYMYNATYAFQENKMGMGTELEGLETDPFSVGRAFHERRGSEFVQENPKTAIAIAMVPLAIITGGLALEALPAIEGAVGSAAITLSNPNNQILIMEGTALVANAVTPGGEDVFPSNGLGGELGNAVESLFKGFGQNIDSKTISVFADAVTEVNKKFSNGEQLLTGGLESAVNSASYYDDIGQQGTAIFNSIVSGHIFENGNKRTASEFITQFAKDNNLNLNLSSKELQNLTTEIANGVKYEVEELTGILFNSN